MYKIIDFLIKKNSGSFTDMTKLLVATGGNVSVEVINLDDSSSNFTCENLPDYPFDNSFGGTGQLFQMIPIICGGRDVDHCGCYSLENGNWDQVTSIPKCEFRVHMASTLFPVEERFVVTGGFSDFRGSGGSDDVEVFNGSYWNSDVIPNLPTGISSHCLIAIDNYHLMVIGGIAPGDEMCDSGYTRHTYIFYNNVWSPGPNLTECRARHSCGIMKMMNSTNGETEKVVVVAGGEYYLNQHNTVELLFWNNMGQGWVMGPSLPYSLTKSSMVEHQGGVILVGGESAESKSRQLYQLSSPNGTWVEMRQTLKAPRSDFVAFLIPDELAVCN
jgi:hypothetical protein